MVKYGIIKDKKLFKFLHLNHRQILELKPPALLFIIERSCSIKAKIVEADERETKEIRYLLNLGYTTGHIIESALDFNYSHGKAISIGTGPCIRNFL
ncbi:MAG: hypothetical protein AB1633_06260 [Elusimicrobiota bacterium]